VQKKLSSAIAQVFPIYNIILRSFKCNLALNSFIQYSV
jgi:hypothetical protein